MLTVPDPKSAPKAFTPSPSSRYAAASTVTTDNGFSVIRVVAEVLRIERNPGHPQAALQVLGETDEWRGLVWEEALIKMTEADEGYDDDDY